MNNNDQDNKMTVYHVDTVKRNQDFVDGKFYTSTEDGFWCGKGMYFWDNKSNAHYWLKDKQRKNPNEKFIIAKATLTFNDDDLLDMTDFESRKGLFDYIKVFKPDLTIKEMKQTGYLINFAHDLLSRNQRKVFSIVKIHGIYKNDKSDIPSFKIIHFMVPRLLVK